jgi:hypothetical protein
MLHPPRRAWAATQPDLFKQTVTPVGEATHSEALARIEQCGTRERSLFSDLRRQLERLKMAGRRLSQY